MRRTVSKAPPKPQSVIVLGSGALQIGQAGEFDYSGSQAIKAFSEEGVRTVLVNPNIATIQTSEGMADRLYLNAVTPRLVRQVAEDEGVDGVALSFGGQTALNCGLDLEEWFREAGIQVLGTPVKSIRDTEDRGRFNARLAEIGVLTARSIVCHRRAEAREAARKIGLPLMLRIGFALGGKGSAIVDTEAELEAALTNIFGAHDTKQAQVLVEESLRGWKEIEYEVVRDRENNCITVCNMENMDPMGIHTGESLVVAPSQTLNDEEYQLLRTVSIRTIQHLGIVGECNVQFALSPTGVDYRVIEVNARLSRSSALASKATGYPLAYVAAKLGLGYTLPDLKNAITGVTKAFFEPALDYLVLKAPRWDLGKFQEAGTRIGSEMKSVGEVMAIGRTFPEVLQKALRMLDIGVKGLDSRAFEFEDRDDELKNATPRRVFALAQALREAVEAGRVPEAIAEIHDLTRIDPWFLHAVAEAMRTEAEVERGGWPIPQATLEKAKEQGFSDESLEFLTGRARGEARTARQAAGVGPHIARIDTLAAEFPAETNYLYSTYHASGDEGVGLPAGGRRRILVIGSGVYRIGSSVEFDWCCVNAVQAAAELGFETLMLNYNPETVSTDYDICDKLVFDEVSVESVLDLVEKERPDGVVVSMGGQIPNRLAMRLHHAGVPILGTSAEDIDRAEDRNKFSALLDRIGVDQPRWAHVTDAADAERIVEELGGFPVLVRPSYVLSGAAMSVAHEHHELARILRKAKAISPEHPVVISKFEEDAREIEIDLVANRGEVVLWAVSEHVEDAGVHSGDATLVLPPVDMTIPTLGQVRRIAQQIAKELRVTGPCNIQLLHRDGIVKVIECNLRASRSLPFVSKVTGRSAPSRPGGHRFPRPEEGRPALARAAAVEAPVHPHRPDHGRGTGPEDLRDLGDLPGAPRERHRRDRGGAGALPAAPARHRVRPAGPAQRSRPDRPRGSGPRGERARRLRSRGPSGRLPGAPPRGGPGRAADHRSVTRPARGHRACHPRGGQPPRPRLERLPRGVGSAIRAAPPPDGLAPPPGAAADTPGSSGRTPVPPRRRSPRSRGGAGPCRAGSLPARPARCRSAGSRARRDTSLRPVRSRRSARGVR